MKPANPRVLLDTNIFISFLLTPGHNRAIARIIESAASGRVTLVLPEELVDEFYEKITTKRYLARRIDADTARQFVQALAATALLPDSLHEPVPSVVRDPKDNYLIAHALLKQVDYLITGDRDLLDLAAHLLPFRIVQPAAFVRDVLDRDRP